MIRRWLWVLIVAAFIGAIFWVSGKSRPFEVTDADVLNDYCFCNGQAYSNKTIIFYTSNGFVVLNEHEYFFLTAGGRCVIKDETIINKLHEFWINK